MIRLLADENFNASIVRGLVRRLPHLDIVRAQEVGLGGADDPSVSAWAAQDGRVLLTHDVRTVTKFAWDRVARGDLMPGVVEVRMGLGRA